MQAVLKRELKMRRVTLVKVVDGLRRAVFLFLPTYRF